MKRACADNWENIVELAEGRKNEAAQAHVESCVDCAKVYAQLKKMVSASERGIYAAPTELINRAIGLMPKPIRVRAGLLRTTLGLVGARAEADDFQIVVSVGDEQNRLMYVREQDGWEVIGRLPNGDWRIERSGEEIETDNTGRFSFKANDLEHTGFEFVGGSQVIEIPSAEELLLSGN
ncbi:MAG: hypothetical protein ACAH95_02615 [Fimbriimonas sp.]